MAGNGHTKCPTEISSQLTLVALRAVGILMLLWNYKVRCDKYCIDKVDADVDGPEECKFKVQG